MIKKSLSAVALVVVIGVAGTGCAESKVSNEKFQSELVEATEMTKAQAKCIGDKVFAELSQSDIDKLHTVDDVTQLPVGLQPKYEAIVTGCLAPG